MLAEAFATLSRAPFTLLTRGPVIRSAPVGPSLRRYANSAAVVATNLAPEALLDELKAIERHFGRRTRGQRWSARVLDLDVILWDGGVHHSRRLTIPHIQFRERDFVLTPALAVAPGWRDPLTGLSIRHLAARHRS